MNLLVCVLSSILTLIGFGFTFNGLSRLRWAETFPWRIGWPLISYLGSILLFLALSITLSLRLQRPAAAVGLCCALLVGLAANALWPMLATLLFCVSAILLGQKLLGDGDSEAPDPLLSFILGAGVFGLAVGLLAHFPVNYPGVYAAGLALPFAANLKGLAALWSCLQQYCLLPDDAPRDTVWYDHVFVAIALIYVVVALMPEVGYDPLVLHLHVPSQLYSLHKWGFDFSSNVLAVMPMQADWLYAIGYMLAGESGARLVNVSFVFALCLLCRHFMLWAGGNRKAAALASLILLTTPLTFTLGSTLHVDVVWSTFLLASLLTLCRQLWDPAGSPRRYTVSGMLLGFAIATKAISLLMAPVFCVLMAWRYNAWYRRNYVLPVLTAVGLVFACGSMPYLVALYYSGNPVFPFFNAFFKSPYYPIENFHDTRWMKGMTWDLLYAITFRTQEYQEARAGNSGFQWLLLLAPSVVGMVAYRLRRAALLAAISVVFLFLVFHSSSYLRYIYPAFVLMIVALGAGLEPILRERDSYGAAKLAVCATVVLNILLLNAGSWYDAFPLRVVFDPTVRRDYLAQELPERAAVELVNHLNTAHKPVALLAYPYVAGLETSVLHPLWYNPPFRSEVEAIRSEADAVRVLAGRNAEFTILRDNWAGSDGKQATQRRFVEAVTEELGRFGSVSVRRISQERLFQEELLACPDFSKREAWTFAGGVVYDEATHSVLVSEKCPATQNVKVVPGRTYLNVVQARCHGTPTQGRLQINWHDARGAFIKADGIQFQCEPDWSEHSMKVTAPMGAMYGVVYTAGHTSEFLEYRLNSLRQ